MFTAASEYNLRVKLKSHGLVREQELKFRTSRPSVLVLLIPRNATLKYSKRGKKASKEVKLWFLMTYCFCHLIISMKDFSSA